MTRMTADPPDRARRSADRKTSSALLTAPLLLTIEQAAELIAMSPRYVRRLVAERRIPVCRFGRAVRLSADDLTAYVADCTTKPITPSTVWADLRKAC